MQARRQWSDIFKVLKENKNKKTPPSTQNPLPSKNTFQKRKILFLAYKTEEIYY